MLWHTRLGKEETLQPGEEEEAVRAKGEPHKDRAGLL